MIVRVPALFGMCLLLACDSGAPPSERRPAPETAAPSPDTVTVGPARTIVFLGTSLTAGYGLNDPGEAYPAHIQRMLDSAGLDYQVVNAGVSGETSAGARRRIDWILRAPPAVLVIETGANDGLRGQDPDSLRTNIQAIIDRTRAAAPATKIILLGMEALPNLGARYTREFRAVYTELARDNDLTLVPFLLQGIGGVDSLNQGDGIHPNQRGARLMAENVWPALERALRE